MTAPTHHEPSKAQARTKRTVMYLRVASRQPGDLAAIESQRAACHELARQHGLSITREYVDVGRSGPHHSGKEA
ncbi:MAG: Recombinase family protein [Actinomycetota bacterium]|nr:Recombinase family protein [Actinomycetota bacterium]